MTGTSGGVQEFRPSADTARLLLRSPVRWVPLLLLAYFAWRGIAGEPALLVLVVVALAGVALPHAAWLATGRIRVSDRSLSVRGGAGRTRTVPLAQVASVLLLPGFHAHGNPPRGLLVVLDADRRPLLRLDGESWGRDTLREVAAAVPVPVTVVEDDLTPGELAWRRMYELPWWGRHPVSAEVALVVVVLAITAAVVVGAG